MKLSRLFIGGVIFLTLAFSPISAFAEAASPKAVLQEIVAKLKSTGSSSVVVDYVHWQSAFDSAKTAQLRTLGVRTPKELKEYYRKLLSNPVPVIRSQLTIQIETLPEEKQEAARKELDRLLKEANVKFKDSIKELKQTGFEVGEESITGNSATVGLTSSYQGQTKTDSLNFTKINKRWYLQSFDKIGNSK